MRKDLHRALLSTGSNMGDGLENLRLANQLIERHAGSIGAASRVYCTAPWGVRDQADYYNQALLLHTSLSPLELLHCLQNIEAYMGRIRETRWGARLIDLDIIFYEDLVVREERLTIPHPRMTQRRFVLAPLADIAPDWVHPENGKTVRRWLADTTDDLPVRALNMVSAGP